MFHSLDILPQKHHQSPNVMKSNVSLLGHKLSASNTTKVLKEWKGMFHSLDILPSETPPKFQRNEKECFIPWTYCLRNTTKVPKEWKGMFHSFDILPQKQHQSSKGMKRNVSFLEHIASETSPKFQRNEKECFIPWTYCLRNKKEWNIPFHSFRTLVVFLRQYVQGMKHSFSFLWNFGGVSEAICPRNETFLFIPLELWCYFWGNMSKEWNSKGMKRNVSFLGHIASETPPKFQRNEKECFIPWTYCLRNTTKVLKEWKGMFHSFDILPQK